jgi:hypothetical protein
MNLLEYIQRSLDAPKKTLAFQLLNKSWNTEIRELRKQVPKSLYDRFTAVQRDVLTRLDRLDGKPQPVVRVAVQAIGVSQHSRPMDDGRAVGGYHDTFWVDQIWAQIVEDLEATGRASSRLDESDRAAFVLLYTIAHACLFVVAKVHVPEVGDRCDIALAFNPDASQAHRLYWFAHYMSELSTLSDHVHIQKLLDASRGAAKPMHVAFQASSATLIHCRDYFADKCLSLHPDYVHLINGEDRAAIDSLSERLGLIVYVYLSGLWQQLDSAKLDGALRFDRLLPFVVDAEDLRRAGFRDAAVGELVEDCRRQPIGDRFLVDIGGGRLQIGDLSLKYALQTYCHKSLVDMNSRGDWFEWSYIAHYIRERVPRKRYRVFPGINDKSEGYDTDVIIEDMRTGALLFCQVKHRATTLHAHLRDELSEYLGNGEILKGLRQLKELRARIGSNKVLDRVRQTIGQRRLNAQDLVDRARYLLIHNVENLDFCTSEGVAMYEWNTLRNLMKGTMSVIERSGMTSASMAALEINLDDPRHVMEAVCGWIEKSLPAEQTMRPSLQWKGLTSSRLVFRTRRSLYLKNFSLLACGGFRLSFPLT